jgi:hypothetical protein
VRKIPLRNKDHVVHDFALVDDADFEAVARIRWFRDKKGYVRSSVWTPGIGVGVLLMHRLILSAPRGMHVDHINRNPLDNQRANLRLCTRQQNAWNRPSWRPPGLKGTTYEPRYGRWRAQMRLNGRTINLGSYDTQGEAKAVFDRYAREIHGEFFCEDAP